MCRDLLRALRVFCTPPPPLSGPSQHDTTPAPTIKLLNPQRKQLSALEAQRRDAARAAEAALAAELAKLDDRAKEERLKQVAAVEAAYEVRQSHSAGWSHLVGWEVGWEVGWFVKSLPS